MNVSVCHRSLALALLWLDFKRLIYVKTSLELVAWEEAIWHLILKNSSNHNTQTLAAADKEKCGVKVNMDNRLRV